MMEKLKQQQQTSLSRISPEQLSKQGDASPNEGPQRDSEHNQRELQPIQAPSEGQGSAAIESDFSSSDLQIVVVSLARNQSEAIPSARQQKNSESLYFDTKEDNIMLQPNKSQPNEFSPNQTTQYPEDCDEKGYFKEGGNVEELEEEEEEEEDPLQMIERGLYNLLGADEDSKPSTSSSQVQQNFNESNKKKTTLLSSQLEVEHQYESLFQDDIGDPVLRSGPNPMKTNQISAGGPGYSAGGKRVQKNSKSLINGQQPQKMIGGRGASYASDFSNQLVGGFTQTNEGQTTHYYGGDTTLTESKRLDHHHHRKSGELPRYDLFSGQSEYQEGEEGPSGLNSYQLQNVYPGGQMIGSSDHTFTNQAAGKSIFGYYSSSCQMSYNHNFSQTAVDDKHSNKSWTDSCGNSDLRGGESRPGGMLLPTTTQQATSDYYRFQSPPHTSTVNKGGTPQYQQTHMQQQQQQQHQEHLQNSNFQQINNTQHYEFNGYPPQSSGPSMMHPHHNDNTHAGNHFVRTSNAPMMSQDPNDIKWSMYENNEENKQEQRAAAVGDIQNESIFGSQPFFQESPSHHQIIPNMSQPQNPMQGYQRNQQQQHTNLQNACVTGQTQGQRALSHDNKAASNQQYFGGPPKSIEEVDVRSNMSLGKFSAFSEGVIYAMPGCAQPGTLGFVKVSGGPSEQQLQLTNGGENPYGMFTKNQQVYYATPPPPPLDNGNSNYANYSQQMQHIPGCPNQTGYQQAFSQEQQHMRQQVNQNQVYFNNTQQQNSYYQNEQAVNFAQQQQHQQMFGRGGIPIPRRPNQEKAKGAPNSLQGDWRFKSNVDTYEGDAEYPQAVFLGNQLVIPGNYYVQQRSFKMSNSNPNSISNFNEPIMQQPYYNQGGNGQQPQPQSQIGNHHINSGRNPNPPYMPLPLNSGASGIGIAPPPKITQKLEIHHSHENQGLLGTGPMMALPTSQQFFQQAQMGGGYQQNQIHYQNSQTKGVRSMSGQLQNFEQQRFDMRQGGPFRPQGYGNQNSNLQETPRSNSLSEIPCHHFTDIHVSSAGSHSGESEPTSNVKEIISNFDNCHNQSLKFELLKGKIFLLALDQTGSRFLQKLLNRVNQQIIGMFLNEIGFQFWELMIDNYGNYFCQKLLQTSTPTQRLQILTSIKPKFIEICCNKRGTHSIQSMFEIINMPEEMQIITETLSGKIIKLSQDDQGNHVVKKVLSTFKDSRRDFIFEEVYNSFIDVAKNANGLCVVKELIQTYSGSQEGDAAGKHSEFAVRLMRKMHDSIMELVQDPYGNYAVTEAIQKWDISLSRPLFESIRAGLQTLCNQKYSSPVVEQCLDHSDSDLLMSFYEYFITTDSLAIHMRNQYGNYVIQKALKKMTQNQGDKTTLDRFLNAIFRKAPEIPDKKIKNKWEQIARDAQKGIFLPELRHSYDGGDELSPNSNFQSPQHHHQRPSSGAQQASSQSYKKSQGGQVSYLGKPPKGGNPKIHQHSPTVDKGSPAAFATPPTTDKVVVVQSNNKQLRASVDDISAFEETKATTPNQQTQIQGEIQYHQQNAATTTANQVPKTLSSGTSAKPKRYIIDSKKKNPQQQQQQSSATQQFIVKSQQSNKGNNVSNNSKSSK